MTKRRKQQFTRTTYPKPTRHDARHEAAHAVVCVRVGLGHVLESTDVRRRIVDGMHGGEPVKLVSRGFTALKPGTLKGMQSALPEPDAILMLKRLGVQIAAGVVCEVQLGASINGPDAIAHRDDVQQLVQIAGTLGIGYSTVDKSVRDFIDGLVKEAWSALTADDGLAWDRVTTAPYRKQRLTGAEVIEIVSECPVNAAAWDFER